jgi:secreted trypsin-like serine protease
MLTRSLLKTSSLAFFSVFAASIVACSAPTQAETEATEGAIIGGVEISSPKFDAVGSMQLEYEGRKQAFCTATLIAPNLVLTAKHCAIAVLAADAPDHKDHLFTEYVPVFFGVGNDSAQARLAPAETAIVTSLSEGGAGYGSDVAIYILREPVTGVTPFPVARASLSAADVGQPFMAMGYGVRDAAGSAGYRTMGNITLALHEGNAFKAAYGDFETFKRDIEGRVGRPLTAEELAEMQTYFEEQRLLQGYEAFFGAKEGDVQPCSGDSGGPLLRKVNGQITVFGVASWVPNKAADSQLCSRGIVYATMGPAAVELLDRSNCGTETASGRCDGTTAVRCTTPGEGGVRVTKTRCEELDLACGMVNGKVGCVEPSAPPPAPTE